MAKNWTAAEAAKVAFEGTDLKAIGDLTRRFPFFTMLCTRLNEAGVEALSYLPEWITARKLEKAYKMAHGLVEKIDTEDDDDADTEEETPKKAAKAEKKSPKKKASKVEDDDDEDEDDEEEAPKKKAKKEAPKKKSKKSKDDDDDDDDFDFE